MAATRQLLGQVGIPTTGTTGRQFDTGIPGFENLAQIASGNVQELLAGVESPAITQNINAQWGVGAGVPGSEFLRNRAVDLYGQRAEERKGRGLDSLLKMMQGFSGTAVAAPASILQAEESAAGRGTQMSLAQLQNALDEARLREQAREFNAQYGLNAAELGNKYLNTYMGWLG